MLDSYLKVLHQGQEKLAAHNHLVELMMRLPDAELHEMAKTGHIKVGYFGGDEILGSNHDGSWLDHFKGTPLLPKAIALLEEELTAQAADDQSNQVQDAERSQKSQARDSIRMEKRLLELELVKQEEAAMSAEQPPPEPSPGVGLPPEMPPPPGMDGGGEPGVVSPEATDTPGAKVADVKQFLSKAGPAALKLVKAHPAATAGLALGTLHGLTREGGGLGSGIVEGVGGGVIGEAGQHALGRLRAPGQAPAMPLLKAASKEEKEPTFHRLGRFLGKHHDTFAGAAGVSAGAKGGYEEAKKRGAGKKGRIASTVGGALIGGLAGRAGGRLEQGYVAGQSRAHGRHKEAASRPPFPGEEKDASPSTERVVRALRGASAERVNAFKKRSKFQQAIHQVRGLDERIQGFNGPEDAVSKRHLSKADHHARIGGQRGMHADAATSEEGRRSGRRGGLLHGAAGGTVAGATAASIHGRKKKEEEKIAFGALLGALGGAAAKGLAGGAGKGLLAQGMNWMKSNPMKALGGAANGVGNFIMARKNGEGMGSAMLAGGAGALGG